MGAVAAEALPGGARGKGGHLRELRLDAGAWAAFATAGHPGSPREGAGGPAALPAPGAPSSEVVVIPTLTRRNEAVAKDGVGALPSPSRPAVALHAHGYAGWLPGGIALPGRPRERAGSPLRARPFVAAPSAGWISRGTAGSWWVIVCG